MPDLLIYDKILARGKGAIMSTFKKTLELDNDEYVSQIAFYLKNKLIKIKKIQKKFDISDLDNLKMESDKVVCFVENSEKTSRHKVTIDLKK